MASGNDYNFYFSNNVQKQFHIVFTDNGTTYDVDNSMIVSEQLSLEESLCSEDNLRFGACESSLFKAQIVSPVDSLVGKIIDVYMIIDNSVSRLKDDSGNYIIDEDGNYIVGVDNSAQGEEIFLGRYKVYSDKPVADRSWRDIEAYDTMKDILETDVKEWYEDLTFPITIGDLFLSLIDYLNDGGVVINFVSPQDLINYNQSIPSAGFAIDGYLSAKTVLEAICELNGVFGHMNAFKDNGVIKTELEFINVASYPTTYIPEWYIDGSGSYEDYEVEEITGIIARDSENESGTTVGTTENAYIIENNPLIYGLEGTQELETILTNTLYIIGHITYRPFQVTSYGNPMTHLGDKIRIATRNQTIESFVLHRTLTGIQAMKDVYIATGEPKQTSNVNSMSSQIMRTKGKVHIIQNDVNGLKSTVTDIADDLSVAESEISQMANEIVLKVDSNGNMVEVGLSADPSTGTTFQVSADNIDFIANNMMKFVTGTLGIESDNFNIDSSGNVTLNGQIIAKSGTIGGFTISSTTNQGTTEAGGHYYTNSLYVHTADSEYEYEIGIEGGNSSPTSRAFYVIRIPLTTPRKTWTQANVEDVFRVRKDGKLYANDTEVDEFTFTDKMSVRVPSVLGDNSKHTLIQPYSQASGQGYYIRKLQQGATTGNAAIDVYAINTNDYTGRLLGNWLINSRAVGGELTGNRVTSYWRILPEVDGSGVTNLGKFLKFFNSDGNVSSSTFAFTNNGNNTMVASGTITQGSSRKIKENIEDIPIEEAEKILELEPVRFDYIHGMKDRRGFIAEDVAEVLPNLVTPEEEDIPASLDYNGIIPYLVKMVQKQQEEINELKRRLNDG